MSNTLARRRDTFFGEFDNLVRAAFGPSTYTGLSRQTGFNPAAEAHRDGDDAVIRLELPGVSTDDVTVEVKGRHLVISGSRSLTGLPALRSASERIAHVAPCSVLVARSGPRA